MKKMFFLFVWILSFFFLGMMMTGWPRVRTEIIGAVEAASFYEKKACVDNGDVDAYIHIRDSILNTPGIPHCNYFYYALVMATMHDYKPANYDVYRALKIAMDMFGKTDERTIDMARHYLEYGAQCGDKRCIEELDKIKE